MAKRVFQTSNWTPTATADTTTLASGTYMAVKGGSTTQRINILEVYIAGMAATTSPTAMSLGRSTTLATTPTALAAPASDGPVDGATAALAAPPITFTAAATGGQRSAATTDAKLMLGFNAFGGIIRYNAAPGQEFVITGNATSLGESYLSAQNLGTSGLIDAHILYEPF